MHTGKGRRVVTGCRKLSNKRTGFEHMRGACRDALPHACREFWRIRRSDSVGEAYLATPVGIGLGSHPPTLNFPRRTVEDNHLPQVSLNDGLSEDLHAARTVTNGLFYQG